MWKSLSVTCVTGRWFSPSTLIYSINKTDSHHITEILLKVALNTINQTKPHLGIFCHSDINWCIKFIPILLSICSNKSWNKVKNIRDFCIFPYLFKNVYTNYLTSLNILTTVPCENNSTLCPCFFHSLSKASTTIIFPDLL